MNRPTRRGVAAYPVDLDPVDIEPYRAGNTGVPFFQRWTSAAAGPHVTITAIVHGNELCGALALDSLHRDGPRPRRGSLTVGFCNIAAYRDFDPDYPVLSRFIDEDLNRLWDEAGLTSSRPSLERARALAIRPILERTDFLLDLHSMQHAGDPMVLAGSCEKSEILARRLGFPATIVVDDGHAEGTRMRDYAFFDDPGDPRAALLVECGQHWAPGSVAVAREAVLRFLVATGSLDNADLPEPPPSRRPRLIRVLHAVTARTRQFAFNRSFRGMESIPKAGTVIAHDGAEPILTPFDDCVLVLPSRRLAPGQTAVRFGKVDDA